MTAFARFARPWQTPSACWQVRKSDVASLEMFYDPPFASFNNEPRPQIWFALH
jgi:hypothetical protein